MIKRAATKKNARNEAEMKEKEIDENIEESFPASDPPSWTPSAMKVKERGGKAKKRYRRGTGRAKT